ncbi:MAG: helix-turn-helix domain-containing protein [Clostridia bacterium]|nr:helix-turn-helix domain-containing protein [Clostridia bacterium]
MFKDYPNILTPKDVAAALGISKNSVYRLIRDNLIGCKHIGRKILIPKIALLAYARSALYTVKS